MAPPPVVIWKVCAASECSTNSISTALNCFREINFGARRLSPSLGQTWASREPLFDYQISTHTTCSCMMRACMRFAGAPKRSNPHTPQLIRHFYWLTDCEGRARNFFLCVWYGIVRGHCTNRRLKFRNSNNSLQGRGRWAVFEEALLFV